MARDPKEYAENFAQACVAAAAAQADDDATLNLACEYLELRSRVITLESIWGWRIPVTMILTVMAIGCMLAIVAVGIVSTRLALAECQESSEQE